MNTVFDPQYLFSVMPGAANLGFWRPLMIISAGLVAFAVVAFIISRRYTKDGLRRRLWQRYGAWALTFSSVTLLLAFFRIQNAYLLSMRVLIFIWIGFCLLWLARIVIFNVWKFPKKLRARDEKAFFEQYLPHKKK